MAGLLAGPFLTMMDSNIVNVALPQIATSLHTSYATAQWIASGYLLALAAVLAATAYLAKRFGTRRVYLASLLGFTVASMLCALAPTIGLLIAARVLQGALGAPLVPLAMGMLLGEGGSAGQLPPAAGMVLFLAPAIGPTIGGLLIRAAGWPLIFLVNVPFGIIGALGVLRIPAEMRGRTHSDARFDPIGMALLAVGLVLAIYGATQGAQHGWGSNGAWPYLAVGVTLLAAYVVWALRRDDPAVDLKLLRHGHTALAVGLCALASVVMFAMLILTPIFLEELQGLSALQAGLALLPQGIVTGAGTVLGNRLAARRGVRFSAVLGLAILTLCTSALLLVGATTPAWVTALILSGRGLAVGLTIQPLLTTMIGDLDPVEVPDGNTLFNVAQRLGGSLGIPLLTTFFALRESSRVAQALRGSGLPAVAAGHLSGTTVSVLSPALRTRLADAAVSGFHDTVWLLVLLSALGVFAAIWLNDRRAQLPARDEKSAA